MGRVDELRGFKENVILGHLVPGGTGFPLHRNLKLVPCCEPIPDDEWDRLREEARKHHDELNGIPTVIQNENDDDEDAFELDEDIAPKNVSLFDTGDDSADGIDLLGADETMGLTGDASRKDPLGDDDNIPDLLS